MLAVKALVNSKYVFMLCFALACPIGVSIDYGGGVCCLKCFHMPEVSIEMSEIVLFCRFRCRVSCALDE